MNDNSLLLILVLIGAVLGILLLSSGSPSELPTAEAGTSAGAASGMPQAAVVGSVWASAGEDRTVGERETIQLEGAGGDSANAGVTYRWTADSSLGFFSDPTRPDAKYTAPSACDCCETVTLTLTVTGRAGNAASDAMTLRVRDFFGCPSPRTCGEPIAILPRCPTAVVASHCPKPDVPCAGPCVTEAPRAPACSQVPVPCRCAGGCEAAWDSAWPQVVPQPEPRDRPTPRIVRQFPSRIAEGSSTPLRAVVANPGCSSVCFSWSASQGWFDRADTLDPVYHAPLTERADGERVTITFTIVDAIGRPLSDQIRLHVDNLPTS